MVWPLATLLAFAALAALHFWWRKRLSRVQEDFRRQTEKLEEAQQRTSAQLQTQQEALFNSMVEGLLLLDANGRIQLANRTIEGLFGVAGDPRGKTIMEALRLHELAELVGALETEGQVLGYELKLSRPNERWLQVNGAAIFNGNGQRHGAVLVFHDLTRLKQLENVRTDFVANVSHELRTPLSLIKGYVETLLDGARNNPDIAVKFLQTIARNTDRLSLLIEDLLTISALESGRVKLNIEAVALHLLVERVFADYKTRAAARETRLINQVPNVAVRADAARLEQVLSNLVDNAIKYGRPGGAVTVGGGDAEDGKIEVFVADDGPGIPPAALERVFERFYRVDKARSREQGGTGLGLSIVKHLVQSHGGKVWAKSEPGKGAVFYFTLAREIAPTSK